ncbi:GNAT family N-acetyltransferase [Streptomyces sp. SM10]|uniref:GNAT family N-acetyltransferase n=1 Tax=Streptomyces sp. SM10 TaxID=565556 RepID=UPI000CD59A8D|nr:GNAT family N-acetyltransferase [Streptomyces sp. SM10]
MSVTIRPYEEGDADDIAGLYGRHRDNPNPVAGGISGEELARELVERDTATFLVALDEGRVVGTFGLFHSTGRRSARAGELIADMFFVAPAYRNGVVTGRLFTEAVEWMMRTGCLVLRLTVNPANSVAFKLYRRVGCVSVGQTVPGEDGNVELHNYIPLILRSVFADLDDGVRAALGGMSSFGTVTQARADELRTDVVVSEGIRTVAYCLSLGDYRLTAEVDVDRGCVRGAQITGPDGTGRALAVTEPPYEIRVPRRAEPYRFTDGGLTCEVDGDDGTVRVFAPGHHGPLSVSTWPSCRADRSAGWREGEPLDLRVDPVGHGVRISERCGDDEVTGTVTLADGVLSQDFTFGGRPGRVFQTVGLRQGTLALPGPDGGPATEHPLGIGLGVRDSSEVVAASSTAPEGSVLTWSGSAVRIQVPAEQRVRLIHATLLERRPEPGADGVARLRTTFSTGETPGRPPLPAVGPRPATQDRRLTVDAPAAGVTVWREGATKVLRSPYPRTRAFGCNPRWSAGMWVALEQSRSSRASGLGWGVHLNAGWAEKHALGLFDPERGIDWDVTASGDGPLRVDVRAPFAEDEAVLWITPDTGARASVVIDSAGTRWELDSPDFRQVWAAAVSVRLSDGSWLDCRPAGTPSGDAEIVLRTTPSGLLVGCVAAADGQDGVAASWHLAVRDGPGL